MKQQYEIIASYQGEKPELPSTLAYLPYPMHTYQPPNTEKVHQGTDYKSALMAFNTLKSIKDIVRIDLFHGGERQRQWLR
jgi:hypothetical protein